MVDLRESCMRKWESISERIMEQTLVEAKTSAKTRQMIENKKCIPGKTQVCTIYKNIVLLFVVLCAFISKQTMF